MDVYIFVISDVAV